MDVVYEVDGIAGGTIATVDLATEWGPARQESVTNNTLKISAFGVSVITLPLKEESVSQE